MVKPFEEALADLIDAYLEAKSVTADEIISALEIKLMACKEELE